MATEKPKLLRFQFSPDAGMAECICSACRKQIEEDCTPVRLWPKDEGWEMRFHPDCFIKVGDVDDYDFEWGDK